MVVADPDVMLWYTSIVVLKLLLGILAGLWYRFDLKGLSVGFGIAAVEAIALDNLWLGIAAKLAGGA